MRLARNTEFMGGNDRAGVRSHHAYRPSKKNGQAPTGRIFDRNRFPIGFIIRRYNLEDVISVGNTEELKFAAPSCECGVYRSTRCLLEVHTNTFHRVLVIVIADCAGNAIGASDWARAVLCQARQRAGNEYKEHAGRTARAHGTSDCRAGRNLILATRLEACKWLGTMELEGIIVSPLAGWKCMSPKRVRELDGPGVRRYFSLRLVEPGGFEPPTSSMPSRRAPNCATAPPDVEMLKNCSTLATCGQTRNMTPR